MFLASSVQPFTPMTHFVGQKIIENIIRNDKPIPMVQYNWILQGLQKQEGEQNQLNKLEG